PTPIIATSRAVAREYASIGLDPETITVIPPAINPESTPLGDRAALRAEWGVDDRSFVVGMLSEPLRWADARLAADVVLQVAATGRDVRLLVHHAATRKADAERWLAGLGQRRLLIEDDASAEPWQVARGLDAALLVGGELNALDLSAAGSPFAVLTGGGRRMLPLPSALPLLWAMVAGVPVIADASDVATDVIVEGESGLLITPKDRNAAADRIMRLYDDPTIAGRIGLQARQHVAEAFGVSAYCVRVKEQYEAAINDAGSTPRTPDVRHADPAVTPVAVG
ncbi:MAG: glycosyltransferase, partial [Phycisphaerales bacterium]|nr:glycosyltransferase [Phycisphaerales bacterium]